MFNRGVAAILSPGALSLVVRMFDGSERDRALGIWSALGGGGAALGAAVASSIAATSLAGTSPVGFSRGFTTAALVAAATALVTLAVAPACQTPSSPAGDAP